MNEHHHSQIPWWAAVVIWPIVKVQDGIDKIKDVFKGKAKDKDVSGE